MDNKKDIVQEPIKMGMNSKEIQQAYERYLWHHEFYAKTVNGRIEKAFAIANNTIYFNDRSDYLSALYEVCKALNPNLEDRLIGNEYIEE